MIIDQVKIQFIGRHIAHTRPELAKEILTSYKPLTNDQVKDVCSKYTSNLSNSRDDSDVINAVICAVSITNPGNTLKQFSAHLGLSYIAVQKRKVMSLDRYQIDKDFQQKVNEIIDHAHNRSN